MIERALAAAYPPPIRRRWGAELAAEINSSSIAGWSDSLSGAARLWLRPAQWPASTGSQLRRAVVVLALVTAAITSLGIRTTVPTPATANHGLTGAGLAVLVLGLITLVPLPRWSASAVRAMWRALALPACTAAAMIVAIYLIARLSAAPTGAVRVVEVGFYWLTLIVTASTPAIALCRVDPDQLHVPGTSRATVGLAIVAMGHVIGGGIGIVFASSPAADTLAVMQLALAAVTLLALIDLRRHRLA